MSAPFRISIWSDMRPAPGSGDFERRYAELIDEVKLGEELGFHAFWTTENHSTDDGYLQAQLTLLAGVATVTERLRLFTNVYLLPFYKIRHTLESAIVVDLLSQGRLELGIGAGAYKREFELFGLGDEYAARGQFMEDGYRLLRQGLDEGVLPDGPDGRLEPLVPGPVQEHLPVIAGGMARIAVDRGARLGDGHSGYDYEHPEVNLPLHWSEVVRPAMERHGRTLDDFDFKIALPLWVSDDPERDFAEVFQPAFEYQQRKYVEWYGDTDVEAGIPDSGTTREQQFVATPEEVAERMYATWKQCPWHELGFFYRLPGVPHDLAMANMERISSRLVPALERLHAEEAA